MKTATALTSFFVALATLFIAVPTASAASPGETAIAKAYAAPGVAGYLGAPSAAVVCGLRDGGCARAYQNGSIHWTASTGAHITHGAIRTAWKNIGAQNSYAGYPITDEICGFKNGGCYQAFQNASIHWTANTGAHITHGAIRTAWKNAGTQNGYLGYPSSDEMCSAGSCRQNFQGGYITWTAASGARSFFSTIVVNKKRPLSPISYAPASLTTIGSIQLETTAAAKAQVMINAAASAGVKLTTVSGYRSYATQQGLYANYVKLYGQQQADLISARPGYSEHQTGLSFDIGDVSGSCSLQACFENTPAGSWVRNNAWRYGFIVRYPNGYTGTTGYAYEPWHLRYVGTTISADLVQSKIPTLEQYFHLPAAPNY